MSTALVAQQQSEIAVNEWQIIREQASTLIKSGFLPQSIKTPEQAMAIILTGRELGIGTMAALNNINVIQGKPTVSPQLMLALINKTREVEDIAIETSNEGATCTIKRRGKTPYTASFGPKEAASMGLNTKDNYKKQPATMFKWRAVADAARVTFPDAILGMYTPDEMGAVVTEDGEIIEAEPAIAAQSRKQAANPRKQLLLEIVSELTAKGVNKDALHPRAIEVCQRQDASFANLTDDEIESLIEDFSKWLDSVTSEGR